MTRSLTLSIALLLLFGAQAQTYFYIDEIAVVPAEPTPTDNVSIQLIGNLSDTGAYIEVADAGVAGNTVNITLVANSNGGLTVLVPHTETLQLGQLPAGDYIIDFTDATTGILDGAPLPQHAFTVSGGGGDPCDNLDLVSVLWHPFSDTTLLVHVQNDGPTLFDYPNFILYDAEGDTLAKEIVNFFGIAQESWHELQLMDGITMPELPFMGTMELWTSFTTELACTWEMEFDLCPPGPCVTMYPFVENIGGGLVNGVFNWTIYDDIEVVGSGQFMLNDSVQYATDTICLPPGRYDMNVVPGQAPGPGTPVFGALTEGFFGSATQEVYSLLPVLLPLEFYMPCAEGTIGIRETAPPALLTMPRPGGMLVQRHDEAPLGPVWLFDVQGKLIFSAQATTDRLFVPMAAPGVYILRTLDAMVKVVGGVE